MLSYHPSVIRCVSCQTCDRVCYIIRRVIGGVLPYHPCAMRGVLCYHSCVMGGVLSYHPIVIRCAILPPLCGTACYLVRRVIGGALYYQTCYRGCVILSP